MAATTQHSVYVFDSMDRSLDWLTERGIKVSSGVPTFSTGVMRPKMTEDALIEAARGHQALLGASGARISRRVMESLPELRYISKLGIGCELIDIESATELGVMISNTPVHSEVELVAEHAVALMLGLLKRLHVYSDGWLRAGRWKDPEYMAGTLHHAVVGIVGFGQIGRAVASRLQAWGATLLATDVRAVPESEDVEFVDLDTLLRRADVVTLHAPGRPSGEKPLIDAAALAAMKPTAIIVNTARGNLIDTDALTRRLQDGLLAGAGLDVYDPEPPDRAHALLALPNVLLTPHAAAWNRELRNEMALMAFENLASMFEGRTPASIVNPDVLGATR